MFLLLAAIVHGGELKVAMVGVFKTKFLPAVVRVFTRH